VDRTGKIPRRTTNEDENISQGAIKIDLFRKRPGKWLEPKFSTKDSPSTALPKILRKLNFRDTPMQGRNFLKKEGEF